MQQANPNQSQDIEQPATMPMDAPVDAPVDTPVDTPVDAPVDTNIDIKAKPATKSTKRYLKIVLTDNLKKMYENFKNPVESEFSKHKLSNALTEFGNPFKKLSDTKYSDRLTEFFGADIQIENDSKVSEFDLDYMLENHKFETMDINTKYDMLVAFCGIKHGVNKQKNIHDMTYYAYLGDQANIELMMDQMGHVDNIDEVVCTALVMKHYELVKLLLDSKYRHVITFYKQLAHIASMMDNIDIFKCIMQHWDVQVITEMNDLFGYCLMNNHPEYAEYLMKDFDHNCIDPYGTYDGESYGLLQLAFMEGAIDSMTWILKTFPDCVVFLDFNEIFGEYNGSRYIPAIELLCAQYPVLSRKLGDTMNATVGKDKIDFDFLRYLIGKSVQVDREAIDRNAHKFTPEIFKLIGAANANEEHREHIVNSVYMINNIDLAKYLVDIQGFEIKDKNQLATYCIRYDANDTTKLLLDTMNVNDLFKSVCVDGWSSNILNHNIQGLKKLDNNEVIRYLLPLVDRVAIYDLLMTNHYFSFEKLAAFSEYVESNDLIIEYIKRTMNKDKISVESIFEFKEQFPELTLDRTLIIKHMNMIHSKVDADKYIKLFPQVLELLPKLELGRIYNKTMLMYLHEYHRGLVPIVVVDE